MKHNSSVVSEIRVQWEPLKNKRKHFPPIFFISPGFRRRISLLAVCFMLDSFSAYFSTLEMEATCSSESSVDFQRATRRYIPEVRTVGVKIIRFVGMAGAGIAQSV
jgi:hypothetical protein